MSSVAIIENSIKTIIEDFSDIKKNARISDTDFDLGVKFCILISEGKDKAYAFMTTYGETNRSIASSLSNKLVRTKWISEIITRLVAGNHIIFADMHYEAIQELYNIGMSGKSEKNRVDALKAFIDVTKKPESKIDTKVDIHIGGDMLDRLEATLNHMATNARLVLKSGDIIDAEIIKG